MNEFVYHYTTLSAIPGIVGRKCLCFWATHRAFLNDPQEGVFGRSILKIFFLAFPTMTILKHSYCLFLLILTQFPCGLHMQMEGKE